MTQTCCPNCGIGEVDGPPWNVIVFCPLHAAAPELLAALEAVADGDSHLGVTCWCHRTDFHEIYCQQARAAIAKAQGG